MQKPLGIIMDAIGGITLQKDTSFAILLEAQRRARPIFYMEANDLFLKDDVPYARMRSLQVKDDAKNWFEFTKETVQALDSLAVIFMRKDPPVDMSYIYTTYLLDKAQQRGVRVINRPQSLRDYNEKLFTLSFPQCCPPSLLTANIQQAKQFLAEHKDIIAKPIDGMGGKSVFRLQTLDPNINVILETLTQNNKHYMMVQRYIPEILQGDKRIILINGEPVPYALARIPMPGETRANLAVGGKGQRVKLTDRDVWICQQLAFSLREKGLVFVGIDVIGDYLTEINITSPTGVRELDEQCGLNISAQLLDVIDSTQ